MLQALSSLNILSRNPVRAPCPVAVAEGGGLISRPKAKHRKPAQVLRLVREPPPLSQKHAKALLASVAELAAGRWVLKADLEVVYRELAEREGWPLLHWNRIGKELGKLCRRRQVRITESGKRRRLAAYFIAQQSMRLAA